MWYVLQNNYCPKSPLGLKGKTKTKFDQLNHRAFSVSPMHAREVGKRVKRHKGKFHFVQEYSSGMGDLLERMTGESTPCRFHFWNFLSAHGHVFQSFRPLKVQF